MSELAVVIGAGADELVAAHTLARAGRKVLVIAEHDHPFVDSGWVPPPVVRHLGLSDLRVQRPDPWIAVPLPGGGRLELWRDLARSVEAIRRLSPRDAAIWPAFCERMSRLARLFEKLYAAPPPDPLGLGFAFRVRQFGRQGIEDLLRWLPMSVADLLDDWFECDALKGALGAAGVLHLRQGPRSGGTAFRLLHQHVGSPAGVFRPPRSNVGQVLAQRPGIEIRRGSATARIGVRQGRVSGVTLQDGEEIAASVVVSGADPRRTLLGLVEPGWLEPELVRAARHIRCRGVVARVTLELDRAPGFGALALAPSLDYLERAYDDSKYGRVSQQPYLEALGGDERRVEVYMQYVPHEAAAGEELGDRVVNLLKQHLNGAAVVSRRVLAPRDLERTEGWPEGQAHHAELALDQALWMRPLPGLARYRMPIAGLYLCGPGTHPGGGVLGASGHNCARAVLQDLEGLEHASNGNPRVRRVS